jgi:hypothetical protein
MSLADCGGAKDRPAVANKNGGRADFFSLALQIEAPYRAIGRGRLECHANGILGESRNLSHRQVL